MRKGTKLYSILRLRCPRCHHGSLFEVKNPYRLKWLDCMPRYCPDCGEDFQREVGFYYGAMMVSHALTTVVAVVNHAVVFYFYGWELFPNLASVVTILVVMFPVIFRCARAIWINLFVKYDPQALTRVIAR